MLTIKLSASQIQMVNIVFLSLATGEDSRVAKSPGLTALSTNSISLHFAAAMKYAVLTENSRSV